MRGPSAYSRASILAGLLAIGSPLLAAEAPLPDYRADIKPLLSQYCYGCHGNGSAEGQITLDQFKTDEDLLGHPDVWARVLKNVRAGIMPPAGEDRPTAEEQDLLARWIKHKALGIDPAMPDPGRVPLRRLNRSEYRNTVRDLTGVDYRTDEEFPVDDSAHGFDTVGETLSVSPMLLEKYLKAAEAIVAQAVPTVPKTIYEENISGDEFRSIEGPIRGTKLSFYHPATVAHTFIAEDPGTYRATLELTVKSENDFDPGKCEVVFRTDGDERFRHEFGWVENNKKTSVDWEVKWEPGRKELVLEVRPLVPLEKKVNDLDLQMSAVTIRGPLEQEHWRRSKNYDRFFTRDEPPESPEERREYAREVLQKFVTKAFRRPVDEESIDRLADFAEGVYSQPGRRFEEGIARALVAVLASPRFVFRVEGAQAGGANEPFPLIDEYSLASRLSYLLWLSTPDDELLDLAERGELRKNLQAQVQRMLANSRTDLFVQSFVGQWLQVRDVDGISINERDVMAREDEELRGLLAEIRQAETDEARRAIFRKLRGRPRVELNGDLRRAMRRETEMCFTHVMREDRSVLELLDSDYTFLNDKLAQHYGIPNVTGTQMRRVDLPDDSPRGGVLTHAAILMVTSNPNRTSPVKRGLFVLQNILGSPPPPPPPDVPALEEAAKEKKEADGEPGLRELLALHTSNALCVSCHSRMDPLGLGLENFNAMGQWRDKELGRAIEPAGELVTGETFTSVKELKHILVSRYQAVFYRCLAEKLLTYALGRGLTYQDVHSVDMIVERISRADGRFSALLLALVESPPFQRRQSDAAPDSQAAVHPNTTTSPEAQP